MAAGDHSSIDVGVFAQTGGCGLPMRIVGPHQCEEGSMYRRVPLDHDDWTVEEYDIGEGSTIEVVAREREGFTVFIKAFNLRPFRLVVTKRETVSEVKRRIKERVALDPEEFDLVNAGTALKDEENVEESGVVEGAVISVDVSIGTIRVTVEREKGTRIECVVRTSDTMVAMRRKIYKKTGVSPSDYRLLHEGRVVDGGVTMVANSAIDEGSVISVVPINRYRSLVVKTAIGETYGLEVEWGDTVRDLWRMIYEEAGISRETHKLVHEGVILGDDEATLDAYGVTGGSVVSVEERLRDAGMQIFAKTLDGGTIALEVSKNDRIIDVKEKIQEKIRVAPGDQKLMYQGSILRDDATVEECQIAEKNVINVVARLRGGIQIFARTMDGKSIAFEMLKSDRIIDVKRKIQARMGLAPDEQRLVYQGRRLEDDATVAMCGIAEKSVIAVEHVVSEEILIQSMTGRQINMEVRNTDWVGDVKRRVWMKLGITGGSHVMRTGGRVMRDDHQMLIDYGIRGGSVIEVRPISRMMVSVEDEDGEVEGVEVLSCDTIREVKEKVEEKFGLPVDQQVLCLLKGAPGRPHRMRTRGLCAVIGCDTVPGSPQGACGTAVDEGAIRATLAPLGYDIKVFRNAALADIGGVIDAVKTDLRERHAVLVVFVLGHMRL